MMERRDVPVHVQGDLDDLRAETLNLSAPEIASKYSPEEVEQKMIENQARMIRILDWLFGGDDDDPQF